MRRARSLTRRSRWVPSQLPRDDNRHRRPAHFTRSQKHQHCGQVDDPGQHIPGRRRRAIHAFHNRRQRKHPARRSAIPAHRSRCPKPAASRSSRTIPIAIIASRQVTGQRFMIRRVWECPGESARQTIGIIPAECRTIEHCVCAVRQRPLARQVAKKARPCEHDRA